MGLTVPHDILCLNTTTLGDEHLHLFRYGDAVVQLNNVVACDILTHLNRAATCDIQPKKYIKISSYICQTIAKLTKCDSIFHRMTLPLGSISF
jgi:hypothetical protein